MELTKTFWKNTNATVRVGQKMVGPNLAGPASKSKTGDGLGSWHPGRVVVATAARSSKPTAWGGGEPVEEYAGGEREQFWGPGQMGAQRIRLPTAARLEQRSSLVAGHRRGRGCQCGSW
jgi:hypothetical protein